MVKNRIEYIDAVKGLGIILMILGHIGFGGLFGKWIQAFHMPLFFIISGFFFSSDKTSFLSFVSKKARTLLVPYLFFGFVDFGFFALLSFLKGNTFSFEPMIHFLFVNQTGMDVLGPLWFLTALFISEVIIFFIKKINDIHLEFSFSLVVLIFGYIFSNFLHFQLPWSINAALVGVFFLFVGSFFRKTKCWCLFEQKSKKDIIVIFSALLCLVMFSALAFLNKEVNMRTGDYEFLPLFLISSIGISLTICIVTKFFYVILDRLFIGKVFSWIGNQSIVFLCLNLPFIHLINHFLSFIRISKIVSKCACFIVTCFILYAFALLVSKTFLAFFIGRKSKSKNQ